jgi:lipoate-protein ligase A
MARDIALMRRARGTGETVFSVYSWTRPTLSLGRNQHGRDRYDLQLMRAMGIDVVRRPTGGRALLHDREVTYSVTAPIQASETLGESYGRINSILLAALQSLGVGATVAAPGSPSVRPNDIPCFATPARGELITEGRKLVGSAQWRECDALLQHGSILIEDDQPLIGLLSLARDDRASVPAAATLASALGRTPLVREIAGSLFDAVRATEDPGAAPLDESEVRSAALAGTSEFENELWTWRR